MLTFSSSIPLGNLGLPFLGETLEFISCAYSDKPESFMDKRRLRYGKVFKSHVFGTPTIISTDAEVSRCVLQSDSKYFVPSYPKSLTELMGKSSILLINGTLQRRIHGLVGSFFKSSQLKSQITKDMQRYVQASMEKWNQNCPVYIQDETKNIAFQVLVKALISLDPGEDMEFLKKQFQEFISGLMSLPINIPGTQLYKSLQAKKKMVKFVKKVIQNKKNCVISPSITTTKDVIDVLINDTNEHLTDDLIANNMIDMMIPGEDSVPVLMTLAIKYLSDCPAALQQLTDENMKLKRHKAEIGEQISWSDFLSLPFTQAVITETLRMGNIITGVMRKAMKDVEIKGYLIPKGWCFFAYFRSIHLDKNFYDRPYQFNPWRWQNKDICNVSFTPFGGGQRLCPGLDLARLETSIFLHNLVTKFSWEAEDDTVVNFPTSSQQDIQKPVMDGWEIMLKMTTKFIVYMYQQPAFSHPLLYNHSIQMKPSSYQSETLSTENSDSKLEVDIEVFYSFMNGNNYLGAQAIFNVWTPKVFDTEHSIAQMWISGDQVQDINTMEVGWAAHSDKQTRLFIFWTRDYYKTTGCYDLTCPGFVQTNRRFALGSAIRPVSTFGGKQLEIFLKIYKDKQTGNWWLQVQNQVIGYWSRSIFTSLKDVATKIDWGGEVINQQKHGRHTSTQMGSGHFPRELRKGTRRASYIRNLAYVDQFHGLKDATSLSTYVSKPSCYDLLVVNKANDWGTHLYFGGPGYSKICH
ncbi:hypothetical protein ACFE04_003852 [Oxalis oulophora]